MVGVSDLRDLLRIEFVDHPFAVIELLRTQKGPIPTQVVLEIDAAKNRTHLRS